MIPAPLMSVIADEAQAVVRAAARLGASIAIDPLALLHRDLELQVPTTWSPNRHCQLVETVDGWIAVNLARADDRDAVSAWLECPVDIDPWQAVTAHLRNFSSRQWIERATLLGLPVAELGEAHAIMPPVVTGGGAHKSVAEMVVLDLSALWAGPLCGALLAQASMAVTKIEDPARPDPTPLATPQHSRRLNAGKMSIRMAISDPALLDLIGKADVLITSARPHALERLGLTPDAVFQRNPRLIWVAITAHGFSGPAAMRVGFGDDCATAGGLVGWNAGRPQFLGDALADPLTGLRAAHHVFERLAAGRSGLIDAALAGTAADFAKLAGLR